MSSNHIQTPEDFADIDMEEGDSHVKHSNESTTTPKTVPTQLRRSLWAGLENYVFVPILTVLLIVALIVVPVVIVILVFPTVFTPLLIVLLLGARFFQFIKSGDGFIKAVQLKYLIKYIIFWCMLLFLFSMVLYFPIVKYAPGLKHVKIVGLPLANWLTITCMIIGFYMLGFLLSVSVHTLFFSFVRSEHNDEYRISVAESVSDITNCLILFWALSEVLKRVPIFTQYQTLGLQTSKWVEVAIFALIGCDCITLSTNAVVWLPLPKIEKPLSEIRTRKLVYYAYGMRRSINLILSLVMLLLIWVLYFGSHLNHVAQTERILYIGTWTFVSLLIFSLLWLLKTCTVLTWEAQTIYSRLESEIKDIGWQLCFLCALYYHESVGERWSFSKASRSDLYLGIFIGEFFEAQDHFPILQFKSTKVSSLYYIQRIALYLLIAKHEFFGGSSYATEQVVNLLKSHCGRDDNCDSVKKEDLEKYVRKKQRAFFHWEKFVSMLNEVNDNSAATSSEEIPIENIRICLETIRDNCSILANTISSYMEMVNCLDKIMSWAIIGATFIMWLLLTKLASTKILVIIASPLLAASFIFGDTCKRLFQGIIFIYAVRPLHVGDECDVGEDSELRVISIGVWKTTFSKIKNGRRVEVMYPNSELANKRVLINSKFNIRGKDDTKSGIRDSEASNRLVVSDPEGSNKAATPIPEGSNKPAGPGPGGSNEPEAAPNPVLNLSVIAGVPFTRRTQSMPSSLSLQHFTTTLG